MLFRQRNVLTEAARIARGKIKSLNNLNASNFDALIVPGGFGVAKNLSNFVSHGTNMTVDTDVQRVLKEFEVGKKPIGYE